MDVKTSICVNHKIRDGWHVFQSPEVPGFYVASKDAEKAFNDVGPSLEEALRLSLGIECRVEPEVSFMEFKRLISPAKDKKSLMSALSALSHEISSKRYVVCPA